MIVSGTLAAPFSGGGSLAAVAASISTGGIAVGLVDNYMQAEIKEGRLDPNSAIYKAWNNTYIAYSVLDAGAGTSNIALNSYRALSTISFINNFKNFEGIINTSNAFKPGAVLNGYNEMKTAVSGGTVDTKLINSIKIFNNFDNFVSPFKNFVKKTTLYTAMAIQIATTDVAAINKVSNTIELTINAGKAEISTAEVLLQISNKAPQLAEDLNNAAFISIKNAPDAIAQEGKMALANINNDSFIIATQINNQVIYNVLNLTGATPHFYQSTRNSNPEQQPKCDYCPETNTLDSELCKKLTVLGKNTNNKLAVEKLCKKGISLAVLNTVLDYSSTIQKTFVDDFSEISTVGMQIMNKDLTLVTYWKENGDHYKKRKYHDGKHTNWADNVNALRISDKRLVDAIDHQIREGIQVRDTVNNKTYKDLPNGTFDAAIMGSGYSNGGKVYVSYNREKYIGTKDFKNDDESYNSFMLTEDPYIQSKLKYLDFIRTDLDKGEGGIYKKLYGGSVEGFKLRAANRPGIHSEVLILNEIIKGKNVKSADDVKNLNIKIIVKQKLKADKSFNKVDSNYNHMATCPNCFYITEGVNFILNK
jgi:hypothetical protein